MLEISELFIGLSFVPAVLLKATVLLSCAWGTHAALRGLNPRWRVLLWRTTIVALAVLPAAEWVLPSLEVAVTEHKAPAPVVLPQLMEGLLQLPVSASVMQDEIREFRKVPIATAPPSFDLVATLAAYFFELIGLVWAMACLCLFFAAARAWREVRAVIADSTPAPPEVVAIAERVRDEFGLAGRVEIRITKKLSSPFVTWIRHPVIVLPARSVESFDRTRLEAVLAHEMAHVKTRDPLWMAFARVTASLLWFHPLMWRVRAAHSSACEDVCDGVAASYMGSSDTYAQALAQEALRLLDGNLVAVGVPMLRGADIVQRLRRIQRGIPASPLARRWVAASMLACAALLVLLGSMQLVHAEPETSALTVPSELPDATLREWVQFDAAESVVSRDRTGSLDIYLIAREKDRLSLWREAAERGMPEGQVLLAMCHAYGVGVPEDQTEKSRLLEAAAKQGDAAAMCYYAAALLHGDGVAQDAEAAVALYTDAAGEGDRAAMWRLASLYGQGVVVEKDLDKALDWLEAAANAGSPFAMFQLGQAYFSGNLGMQDEMAGRQWMAFAADKGCPFGVDRLRQLSGHAAYVHPPSNETGSPFGPAEETPQTDAVDPPAMRDTPTPGSMSDAALLAEVTADALACFECRNRTGYSKVYIQLHAAQRLPLWQEAAERGMAPGQVLLGLCYAGMVGFEKDYVKRTDLFRAAAEQGDPTGMHNYASSLSKGFGVIRNPEEAFEWWQKAAELGEPAAMCHLAQSYLRGQYVDGDADAAVNWYLRAAEAGSSEAMYQLGAAYMGGHNMVPTNFAEGQRWLARAAENGFPKAVASLRRTKPAIGPDGEFVSSDAFLTDSKI